MRGARRRLEAIELDLFERGEIWSTRWHLTDTHPDARDQAEAAPHENESSQAESRPLTR
jgi:hypothetical protein